VIAIRLREGRSPFSADKNHLHHRLLGLGFEHFEAVACIYLLQGALFARAATQTPPPVAGSKSPT